LETDNVKIGVDVMKIEYTGGKPISEFFRLMTRNFSNDEWKHIKSYNSNVGKLEAFMRHWCLKESYVKNIGTGITTDLSKLNFITPSDLKHDEVVYDTRLEENGQLLSDFVFEESLIGNEHCVAVALKNPPQSHKPVAFQLVNFEQLIANATAITEADEVYCKNILMKGTKVFPCQNID
jgi:4'-phosphopantetheinyl transferase